MRATTLQETDRDTVLLDTAVTEALRGPRGANPLVGAVITAPDGTVLATGHHRGRGTDHAEVDALAAYRRRAGQESLPPLRDCTIHITLEPCDHHGVTGPCSRAILDAGLGAVRYAVPDPTGPDDGGAARLARHGVDVVQVSGHHGAAQLNRRWHRARMEGRPFITAHLAQSLDGRVAAADGTSQWITGGPSRRHAHEVRARVDAIVVGTGTVISDDPRLTARDAVGADLDRQPLPVVQGLREIPGQAALRRADWLHVRTRSPQQVLQTLADQPPQRPVRHLLIEGGPTVLSAWIAAGLVDELFLYQAPLALGDGAPGLTALGVQTLTDARNFDLDPADGGSIRQLGRDVLLHLTPLDHACDQEDHVHRNHL
ncbi:bifunctional diaminohydroxyphosphoribosylaminopyrimidine deaminase/5-amino-6-(5-phosphoribosylamino)uracil reductase RibD [Micrococcus terreus]|uniref:bifunctional diaminohydroxyphosphoribosylaminopyrimidine deaminase/5-amino-6-(5-phosphoribosylamino)uracil reductase RibD n=1 Tax=Micrococcus terreus TaxID=574650 RepID=UPI0034021C15